MFTETLGDFFDPVDGFAEAALYNGATTLNVIFDRAFVEQFAGVVGNAQPVALGIATEFPDPVGKTLVVKSTTYTITTREPQDDGAMVLMKLQA